MTLFANLQGYISIACVDESKRKERGELIEEEAAKSDAFEETCDPLGQITTKPSNDENEADECNQGTKLDQEEDSKEILIQQDIAAPKEEEKIEAAVSTENPTIISKAAETPVNDKPIVQSTKEDMDLSITVVSCRGLLVGDLDSSDPYVKLYLDGKVIHETKYIKNT